MTDLTDAELCAHEQEAHKMLALAETIGPEGEDVHLEFMLRLIAMARRYLHALSEIERLQSTLKDIHSHNGKTLLADCCVTNSCHEHFVDGEKVSNCAYQYGVFDGYATLASIAEEALRESQ